MNSSLCYFSLMRKLILCIFCFALTLPAKSSKETVVVPIDISAGPAFHFLPPPLADGHTQMGGLALEAYAVITPKVIQDQKDRIPKKWRKLISKDQELQIKPFYLTILPTTFLVHRGEDHEAYAATWSFFGLNWNARPLNSLEFELGVKLPTLTYAWVKSPRIEEGDKTFWGLGLSPRIQGLWRITETFHFSASWDQHLYLPIVTTQYSPTDRSPENWTSHGVASFKLHVRVPTLQKI